MVSYYLLYLVFPFELGPDEVLDGEMVVAEAYGTEEGIDEKAESRSKDS